MKQITFFVEGDPKAQPRPRATVGKTRAHVYDPRTNLEWRARVRVAAKAWLSANVGFEPLDSAIKAKFWFWFDRPQSHYNRDGSIKKSAPPVVQKVEKPDFDNLVKPVCDELKNVGILSDDSIITNPTIAKRWCRMGGGVYIRMECDFLEDCELGYTGENFLL